MSHSPLLVAGAVTATSTPLVIAVLRRMQVVDVPSARSSHAVVTVRGAGWGVLLGAVAGLAATSERPSWAWWLIALSVAFAAIGFLDDLKSLPATVRFGAQLALSAGMVVVAQLAHVVSLPSLVLGIGALGIISYVNAFNFMDGVNAISGLQAVVVGGAIAAAALRSDAGDLEVAGLALLGSAVAFLPFNAVRARAFLGDVGSYFIGAWVSGALILALDQWTAPVFALSVVSIYAADTGATLVQRVQRGEDWASPHRTHVYQRLTDRGWSHLQSAGTVTVFSMASAALGVASLDAAAVWQAAATLGIVTTAGLYVSLPSILARVHAARLVSR